MPQQSLLLPAIHRGEQIIQRFRQCGMGEDTLAQRGIGEFSHHRNWMPP